MIRKEIMQLVSKNKWVSPNYIDVIEHRNNKVEVCVKIRGIRSKFFFYKYQKFY